MPVVSTSWEGYANDARHTNVGRKGKESASIDWTIFVGSRESRVTSSCSFKQPLHAPIHSSPPGWFCCLLPHAIGLSHHSSQFSFALRTQTIWQKTFLLVTILNHSACTASSVLHALLRLLDQRLTCPSYRWGAHGWPWGEGDDKK